MVVPRYRYKTAKFCNRRCKRVPPELAKEQRRAYRYENRVKIRAQGKIRLKRWEEKHPERAKQLRAEIDKRSHVKHRAKRIEKLRARYRSDPAKWRKYHSEWAKKNYPKIKEARRKRYNSDPIYRLKILAICRAREAKKKKGKIGNLKPFLKFIASQNSLVCHYCNERFPLRQIQLDHVKPLAKGGAHAAFNLVPSCGPCNMHKHAKDPNEFIKTGQLILVYYN